MAKIKNISLTERNQLTDAALRAYVANQLSPEQHQEVEEILANDPFAQEAVEGLNASTSAKVKASVNTINENLREKTGAGKYKTKSIQIHWSVFAYAAAMLFALVGIGALFVIYQNDKQSQQLAVVQTINTIAPVVSENKTIDTTTVAEIQDNILPPIATVETSAPMALNEASATPPTELLEKAVAPKADANTRLLDAPAKDEMRKEKEAKVAASPVTTSAAGAVSSAASTYKLTSDDLKKEESDRTPASGYQKGMQYFNSGDYKAAEEVFNEVVKSNPENADAVYFEGVSSYINGNQNKAEQNFDKLLKKGSYSEGSKWYKANILLQKGKKAEAKKLLKELSTSTGIFKERAVKKLEELP